MLDLVGLRRKLLPQILYGTVVIRQFRQELSPLMAEITDLLLEGGDGWRCRDRLLLRGDCSVSQTASTCDNSQRDRQQDARRKWHPEFSPSNLRRLICKSAPRRLELTDRALRGWQIVLIIFQSVEESSFCV